MSIETGLYFYAIRGKGTAQRKKIVLCLTGADPSFLPATGVFGCGKQA
jgi:hypothetical protein